MQSYIVYKRKLIGRARDEVMLNIDGDKLSIIPYAMPSGGLASAFRKEPKLRSYPMDSVLKCVLEEDRGPTTFSITVCDVVVFPRLCRSSLVLLSARRA